MFMVKKLNNKMLVVPFKLVYKFNAFPIKIPTGCMCVIYITLKKDTKVLWRSKPARSSLKKYKAGEPGLLLCPSMTD